MTRGNALFETRSARAAREQREQQAAAAERTAGGQPLVDRFDADTAERVFAARRRQAGQEPT